MAEIRVERKEGRGIWPWVVGVVVLLVVLWLLFGRGNEVRAASADHTPSISSPMASADAFPTFASCAAA